MLHAHEYKVTIKNLIHGHRAEVSRSVMSGLSIPRGECAEEWKGDFDPFSDPEERRVLYAALDSFRSVPCIEESGRHPHFRGCLIWS